MKWRIMITFRCSLGSSPRASVSERLHSWRDSSVAGDESVAAHIVDGRIAGHSQDPGREGHLSFLVAIDRLEKLGEHLLGDVLGVVIVAHDLSHIAEDVVREAGVQIAMAVHVPELRQLNRAQNLVLPSLIQLRLQPETALRQIIIRPLGRSPPLIFHSCPPLVAE
jgi:hypothetical protein